MTSGFQNCHYFLRLNRPNEKNVTFFKTHPLRQNDCIILCLSYYVFRTLIRLLKINEHIEIYYHYRQENDLIDSMGVLGLSSVIRDDMKTKHENVFLDQGLRKTSYNCHEM